MGTRVFIIFCLLFLSCKKASESTGPSNSIINLVEVGYYDTPGIAYDVYVSGQYAYVADGKEGLRIIDISNPSNPREVGFFKTPYTARGVYVSGQYAYVAYGDVGWTWAHGGLYIIDISNPSNPVRVGYDDVGNEGHDVYISGKYAYVANWYRGSYNRHFRTFKSERSWTLWYVSSYQCLCIRSICLCG
jgi:hypothetical protein